MTTLAMAPGHWGSHCCTAGPFLPPAGQAPSAPPLANFLPTGLPEPPVLPLGPSEQSGDSEYKLGMHACMPWVQIQPPPHLISVSSSVGGVIVLSCHSARRGLIKVKAYKALSTKYKALNCNGMRNHPTKVLSLKPAADKDWSAGQMGPQ